MEVSGSNLGRNYYLNEDFLIFPQSFQVKCQEYNLMRSHLLFFFSRNLMFVDPCIIVQFIKKNPTRCNNVSKFYYSNLYEAQHVSGDTPPIIRSLKLHWQPLVFHTWKVVGRVAGGRCPPATRPTAFHV